MLPKDIRNEIKKMAIAMLTVSAVTVAVFFLVGRGTLAVLLGALFGAAIATLNYLLLALTVAFACRNSGKAIGGGVMGFSYLLRILLIGAGVVFAIRSRYLNYIAVIVPLFFPRLFVTLFGTLQKKKKKEPGTPDKKAVSAEGSEIAAENDAAAGNADAGAGSPAGNADAGANAPAENDAAAGSADAGAGTPAENADAGAGSPAEGSKAAAENDAPAESDAAAETESRKPQPEDGLPF